MAKLEPAPYGSDANAAKVTTFDHGKFGIKNKHEEVAEPPLGTWLLVLKGLAQMGWLSKGTKFYLLDWQEYDEQSEFTFVAPAGW